MDDFHFNVDEEDDMTSSRSDSLLVARKHTTVEREFNKRRNTAAEYVRTQLKELPDIAPYVPHMLSGSIFVGHLVTDLDSIAGAIGGAELYGGIPARASEVNPETRFALDYWKVETPAPIEELLVKYPSSSVCLVDHQQTSQLNKSIDVSRIVGVIDHHALQNSTIVSDLPIYIDIRPWGSMSTIIAHTFLTVRKRPSVSTAGMLLCAILSDTLNLMGPTTTEWDRSMVSILAEIAGVTDIQDLASKQFKAKSSDLAGLSSESLVTGDQKVFTFKTSTFDGSVGFAVIETTDDAVILERVDELINSLIVDKEKKGMDVLFLAVVNIIELRTKILLCGESERSLAMASWSNGVFIPNLSGGPPLLMDIGNLVSRKKDFVPSMTKAIKGGWRNGQDWNHRLHLKQSKSDIFDLSKL